MARQTLRSALRLFAGSVLLAAAGTLLLLGRPSEAANPLTLQTITIDGDVGDWDAVLANPLQTTHDGDGSSSNITAACALYSTDRDCPLGGGAGNDLHAFAWTYDASYVYLYMERYGSASNGVDFFFVADTDQDQRVEATGDVVVHATWAGQTGTVSIDAGRYAPVDALLGDPIVSATGYVDGYDLPGTNGRLDPITCGAAAGAGVTGGLDGGRKMELRIPWCAFGLPSQQPFYWHVVSCNNASLSTPLDNVGAPSGGLGTFVQRAVAFGPDRSGAVLSPGAVTYDHALRNDGNDADVFTFAATSSQGATIELLDGAVVIGRDDEGDGAWELAPQVTLAVGASRPLRVRITMPAGRTGEEVTRVTAVSVNDPTVSATATDASHVGSPAFVPERLAAWTRAGTAVPFGETLANGQLAADTFDLTADGGCAGFELRLTADAAGGALVARDADGDGAWDWVDGAPASDANGNGLPDLGAVPGQSSVAFWLWVEPPAGAPDGACTVRLTAVSPTTLATAAAEHQVTVAPAVTFTPSYTRAGRTSRRAGVGGSVLFPAVIRNSEAVSRAYALAQVLAPPGSGASARVWTDPDGDGSPSDGQVITTTGAVAAFGGTQAVVVEIQAGTAASGAALTLVTTATATEGGASAAQTAEADVGWVATYRDALFTQAASAFAPCDTVQLRGGGLLPGDTTSYSLTWLTPSAGTAETVSPWPTTALGTATDAFALPATAATGDWIARLVDGPSTRDQDLPFTVSLIGSVASLTTDRTRYRPGDSVLVKGAFQNAGAAALASTSIHYGLDGVPLRTRAGVTVAAGATATDPFSFTLPTGATPGLRTIDAGWWLSCAGAAFASDAVAFEVQPDPPTITSPTDGARTADGTPAVAGTASPDATVSVTLASGGSVDVSADGSGNWSWTAAPALADGPYSVTATQAVEGVASEASLAVAFTVDTTPPAVPSIAPVASPTNAAPLTVTVSIFPVAADLATTTVHAFDTVLLTGTSQTIGTGGCGGDCAVDLWLPEGTFELTAEAADDLQNASARSSPVAVTIDRTPPDAPVLAPFASPRSDAPIPVAATAEAGAEVRLSVDGVDQGPMAEGPAGSFSATLDLPLDGSYDLTAVATDAAGNAGDPSATVVLDVDRTPPDAPLIAPVDDPTAAEPVPVVVTAAEGATVVLWLDGADGGVAPSVAGATFTFELSLADGPHQVWAFATDAAGNESLVSNTVAFGVDRAPPPVPDLRSFPGPTTADPVVVAVEVVPSPPDLAGVTLHATNLDTLVETPFSTPVSVVGDVWTFELTLPEGSYAFEATSADLLGNVSARSAPVTLTVDRTAPAVPVVTPSLPAVTRDDLLVVAGTAEVGSAVTVTVTGAGPAPAPAPVVAADGAFSVVADFGTFPDGAHEIVVSATDAAGNGSPATAPVTVTVDRMAPAAPAIAVVPSPTRADPVVVTVTAEAGATVVLTVEGADSGVVPAASGTTYGFSLTLAEGSHLIGATAEDAAGNLSSPAVPQAVLVDRTAPASAPTVDPLPAVTNAASVGMSGTTEPGATVTITVGGMAPVTTTADGAGIYSVPVPLPAGDGAYAATIQAADAAGNASPASAPVAIEVDRTAPSAPSIDAPAPAATVPSGSVPVTGTAEPRSTVRLVLDGAGAPLATDADAATGAWRIDAALTDGPHSLNVTATDAAGNASAAATRDFTVATPVPPDAGGGCGCGAGGASGPELLLLAAMLLVASRRRRAP